MKKNLNAIFILFLFLILSFNSCSSDENSDNQQLIIDNLSSGSGLFNYNYNSNSYNKSLKVYYYIPNNKSSTTPIFIVFHGTNRNAEEYRNAMIEKANTYGFIIIAPEFSEQNFPDGNGYNLGNVFTNGDSPTSASINPESQWTFSIVEPLFDYVKTQINNTNNTYDIYGHSAGGQFTHRFLMFKPNARVRKAVISGSGWYTFPNSSIIFPYGANQSPLQNMSTSTFLEKQIIIQVGENDDNPNDAGLRHNVFADAQGLNRKERAISFFQYCQQISVSNSIPFNWNFNLIENADHDYVKASKNAADLIFN